MLVEFEMGRAAGHIGEPARVFDPSQYLSDRGCAAQVKQIFQNREA